MRHKLLYAGSHSFVWQKT